jgi:hypothetical protein
VRRAPTRDLSLEYSFRVLDRVVSLWWSVLACLQYIARVRRHVHVVVCMSPFSDAFRNRIRMFPALVNCTTIDWFSEWPAEALHSVAESFIDESLELGQYAHPVIHVRRSGVLHSKWCGVRAPGLFPLSRALR